MGICIVVVR